MTDAEVVQAPRGRQLLAGLIDAAIGAGVVWGLQRRPGGVRGGGRALGGCAEFLREQVGSPGQRLLGLRTVDRRSDRRVALWRSSVLLATRVAGGLLTARLAPTPGPEARRAHDQFTARIREIHERTPAGSGAREAAMRELFADAPEPTVVRFDLRRTLGPLLAVGLLNARLRRHLAPTTQVIAGARRPHSP